VGDLIPRTPFKEGKIMSTARAAWMRQGKFGMMVHWIPPGPPPQYGRYVKDINKAVDRFDRDRFLTDFKRSGAGR
jgi:hypothetical protein